MARAITELPSKSGSAATSPFAASAPASNPAPLSGWAGYAAVGSDNGNVVYTQTSANWTVPSVSANSSWPNSTYQSAPDIALWTGIGGAVSGNNEVIQAGVASISTATPQYRFWYENYNYFPPQYKGPVVQPGDQVYVDVAFDTNPLNYTTDFFLENMTTGVYKAYDVYTPYWSNNPEYSSADFIAESPQVPVPPFTSGTFSDCLETTFSNQLTTLDSSQAKSFPEANISVTPLNTNTDGYTASYNP